MKQSLFLLVMSGCLSNNAVNQKKPATLDGVADGTVDEAGRTNVSGSSGEDGPLTIDLRPYLPDGSTELLNVDQMGHPGTLSFSNGTLGYDPAGALNHLALGDSQTFDVTFSIGMTAFIAHLRFDGANDVPIVSSPPAAVDLTIAQAHAFDVLAGFTDPDDGDSISITAVTPCANGQASFVGGSVTVSSDVAGDCQTQVTVSDQHGGSTVVPLTVHVFARLITALSWSRAFVVNHQRATLTWASTGASACALSIQGAEQSTLLSGTLDLVPTEAVTARLSCSRAAGPSDSEERALSWVPAYHVAPTGAGDGSGWGNALGSIASAVAASQGTPVEIWLRAGTYYSDAGAPVAALPSGYTARGGYTGVGEERPTDGNGDYVAVSKLSGYTSAGDSTLPGNAQHVAVLDNNTRLEGFTISDGNATNSASEPGCDGTRACGAGVHVKYSRNVTLNRLIVTNNFVNSTGGEGNGAGIYVGSGGQADLSHAQIRDNTIQGAPNAAAKGAGLAARGTVTISDVFFELNSAIGGGDSQDYYYGTALGGAVYCEGCVMHMTDTRLESNITQGGRGIDRPDMVTNGAGSSGGAGGEARGGAICVVSGTLVATHISVVSNSASGGDGGRGGNAFSNTATARKGGNGGNGGDARGGGLATDMQVELSVDSTSSFTYNTVHGGDGGNAGESHPGTGGGAAVSGGGAGAGGYGLGGALYNYNAGVDTGVSVPNFDADTLTGNEVNAGANGNNTAGVNGGSAGSIPGPSLAQGSCLFRICAYDGTLGCSAGEIDRAGSCPP